MYGWIGWLGFYGILIFEHANSSCIMPETV